MGYEMQRRAVGVAVATLIGLLGVFGTGSTARAEDPEPDLIWTTNGTGNGSHIAFRTTALPDGGSVSFGYKDGGALLLGAGESHQTTLSTDYGLFLAKHDAAGQLVWAREIPGGGDPLRVAALSDGTFLAVGAYYDSATFGPDEDNERNATVDEDGDMFVAHYDADGRLIEVWFTAIDGQPVGVAVFDDDSFAVCGHYRGTVTFGQSGGTTATITSTNNAGGYPSSDIFLARYDASGDLVWVKSAGGASSLDLGWDVVALSDGSCVMAGRFEGSATFGGTTITAQGSYDIFVARYLSDGTVSWAQGAGSSSGDYAESLNRGPDDSVVVTGEIHNGAVFAGGTNQQATLNGHFFAARYDKNGVLQWARDAGGTGYASGWSVGSYADGSWVISGDMSGTVVFGAGETNETSLTGTLNGSGYPTGDGFILRLLANGSLAWARTIGGDDYDYAEGLAAYPDGTFVVVGGYGGTATIVPGDAQAETYTANSYDPFFARFRAFPVGEAPTGPDETVATLNPTLPSGDTRTVELSFDSVSAGGVTSVATSDEGTAPPDSYKLGEESVWYEVETTATYSGTIELCFSWNEGDFANESNIALLHYENGEWVDVTTSIDLDANVVCGQTTSLSPFVLAEVKYTFGGIEQPVNADGSSIFKAGRVIPLKFGLTGPDGDAVTGATATLAVYRIDDEITGTDEETDVSSAGQANTGNEFRYDSGSGKYVFNLDTDGEDTGTYRAEISTDDGEVHLVYFSLR